MKLISNIVERKESVIFKLPFEGRCFETVEKGKKVRVGDVLFKREYKRVLESYDLASELGIKGENAREYVARLDGEYVTKGEILAERIIRGGLAIKKVYAIHDGVVSFERLKNGYIDILSEHIEEDVVSDVNGTVLDIDHSSGMRVEGKGIETKFFASNSSDSLSGVFEVVGDGTSVYSQRDLKDDYNGKIVYLGRFAYPDTISHVFKKGARAVVVFSMEFADFETTKFPIYVVGGFGAIAYDFRYAKLFSSMDSSFCSISEGKILWGDNGQYLSEKEKGIVKYAVQINDLVRVLDQDNLSKIGRVVDSSNEDGYFTVLLDSGQRALISQDMLEIVSI